MRLTILAIIAIVIAVVAMPQSASAQAPTETIKVRGCLTGTGPANATVWSLRGVSLPAPPAAPAAGGGGRGGAGGRGGQGGAPPADAGRGGAGAPPAGGGGRGAGGGAPAQAAAPAAPPQPPVDLALNGLDLSPWRNMFVEVEGTLGPRPATGMRQFQVNSARSAYGECR